MILYRVGQTQNASAKMLTEKHDDVPSSGHMRWSRLSQILVESAMVYTLAGIVLLVVNFVGSNAVYPMSDLVSVQQSKGSRFTRADRVRAGRRCRLQAYSTT